MGSESILIVEDEAIVALDLSILLESAGYTINRICNSSNQLLEKIEEYPRPDLILMDINIKGKLDGTEASLIIKERYAIPVIFLTAYTDDITIAKAKNSYPYGFIIKPYDKTKLLIIIEMGLNIVKLENEVKRREELYSATFNSIADAVVITDNHNRIKFINPVALSMVSEKDVKGMKFESLFKIEFNQDKTRGTFHDKFGKEKILEIKKTNLDESNFKQGGYVWILTDITIPVFLESQLRESQKMEAVGRLAGGVAHDFNNLLTVIMGYCSLILDNSELLKKDKTLENDILGIHSTSQKAVNLTKQLLIFSNNQVHSPRHINLNMIIKDLNKIFDRLIPDYISLTNFLADDDTIINVDPVQIEQVLINLVVNSKDAISNKGYIHIRTSIIDSTEDIKNNTGIIPKGEFVLLSIEDSGCGISDEIQTKIFEPFFTTKKEGKGIGLGLSTVYGIVLHSGAYMDLKSSPGKGCIFKIYFPRVLDSIPEKVIPVEYKHMDAGKETVLIVEEDEFVRSIMLRILTIKGYTVIEACHAGEALLLCEKMENICELMITDLFMPQITGQELFTRISKFFPHIKCLYTSTNNLESIKDKSLVNGINNYIQKPFDPEDFSLLVRKSLDSN